MKLWLPKDTVEKTVILDENYKEELGKAIDID